MSDDIFLAKWLAGDIADDELRAMVSPDDFEAYVKLRDATSGLSMEAPDYDAAFARLKAGRRKPQGRRLVLWPLAAVAAAILLLVALTGTFWMHRKVETGKIPKCVTLADGSQVWLNARSRISYPYFFRLRRHVTLEGEAYFEVRKGNSFTVDAVSGSVTVLGTRFNVAQADGFFQTECFEGRVKVSACGKSTVVSKGEGVRCVSGIFEPVAAEPSSPSWRTGETRFRSAPLSWVVTCIERRYGVSVAYPENLSMVRFTGSITHYDLDKALQSLCVPMQWHYRQRQVGKIVIGP